MTNLIAAMIVLTCTCVLGVPIGNLIGWVWLRRRHRDALRGDEPFNWRLLVSSRLYYRWLQP